jgi:hypothetical protein
MATAAILTRPAVCLIIVSSPPNQLPAEIAHKSAVYARGQKVRSLRLVWQTKTGPTANPISTQGDVERRRQCMRTLT